MHQAAQITAPAGLALLKRVVARHWSSDTAYKAAWTPEIPGSGQCAITALKVQELLGGDLLRIAIPGSSSHYANRINGEIYDLTAGQFAVPIPYDDAETRERHHVLANTDTAARYALFSRVVDAELDASLPLTDIEHIAIRDVRYVAGTDDRPEVGCSFKRGYAHER